MSMAINNLQAMLNIEDIDLIIQLLRSNDWDEIQAFNAYQTRQPTRVSQQQQENLTESDGVRAPMRQQDDVLISDYPQPMFLPSFFSARPNDYQARNQPVLNEQIFYQERSGNFQQIRVQKKVPVWKFELLQTYDQDELIHEQQEQQKKKASQVPKKPGMFKRAINFVFGSKTQKVEKKPAQQNFDDFDCGQDILEDDRLLASLEINQKQKFYELCKQSRKERKAVLLLVLKNPINQNQVDNLIQSLVEKSLITKEILRSKFNIIAVSYDHLQTKIFECSKYFLVNPIEQTAAFVLFVKDNQLISIMHRIDEQVLFKPTELQQTLQEYAGLFEIVSQEDVGYLSTENYQTSDFIDPLVFHNNLPVYDQRTPGISPSIQQQAQDEMLNQNQFQENFFQQKVQNNLNQNFGQEVVNSQIQQNLPEKKSQEIPEINQKMENEVKVEVPQQKIFPQIQLDEEPSQSDPSSVRLVIRMPTSGERIQRIFKKDDLLQTVYNFVDYLQSQSKCQFEGVQGYADNYIILQNMPRKVYDEKNKSLEELGLFPRGAMLQIQLVDEEN